MNGKNEVGASIPARLETVGMENPDAAMMSALRISVGEYQTIAGVWG
jgi:hypothetical protein